MRLYKTFGSLLLCSLLAAGCKEAIQLDELPTVVYREEDHGDAQIQWQDGITEALEMEYQLTRDAKLGVVPLDRLVRTYDRYERARRAGVAARTNSLVWSERGPNNNTVAAGNGNTRGPSNNAVTAGRHRAIWVDLNDATSRTVWTASVSGGLWKTNDITAPAPTWQLVNDFLGNLAITSITQDPVNRNIMYFATGERNNNFDAVRGGGVWKSTDNGSTWNLLSNTINFWNISKIVCDASGNVYVGTNGNGLGLMRSTNGGANWTSITPATFGGGTQISELRISSTGRMHVTISSGVATSSGYFYTNNPATVTSATWTAPVTPFPNVQFNCELSVTGNVLYALPSNSSNLTPQIFKSVDGGANWAATTTSPPGSSASEPTINSGQGWYNLAIGADPANPDNVIAGGLNFYRSTDGGVTWTQITRWVGTTLNYVHADHHSVVWNGSQVLLATDGGVFYSNNNGASFTDRNIGLRTKQFYSCAIHPTQTNFFLGGTQDNGTHRFQNAGLSSSAEVLGGDGGYTHIDEDEPQFQFGAFTRSDYFRSSNGGTNWSRVTYSTSVGSFINPTDYDDIFNRMYATGSAGQYVRWSDATTSTSFTPVSLSAVTAAVVRNLRVSNYTPNRLFLGMSNGELIRVDNAHTADPLLTELTAGALPIGSISCVNIGTNDNHLIATFSNYGIQHVFVTSNGGDFGGWTDITGNLPDIPVRWAMFYPDNNTRAIIATDMGLFETGLINGSATQWVPYASFPNVRTNMLQYRFSDRTLLAATHGRGMWTATIPATIPYVRFASSYTFSPVFSEATAGVTATGCRGYTDITIPMNIDAAPSADATVTLSVLPGGTAIEGQDFDISTDGFTTSGKTFTFPAGSLASRNVTVRIYDDSQIESVETFTLSYNISGGSNAQAAPSSNRYTVHIGDNDAVPAAPTTTLLNVTATNYGGYIQPFRGSFAKARSQYIYTAEELLAANIQPGTINSIGFFVTAKQSTQAYNGLRISLKHTSNSSFASPLTFETGAQLCYLGTYSTVAGQNTFVFNQSNFNWDGTSNLLVDICYDNFSGTSDDNVRSNSTTQLRGIWGRINDAFPSGCDITTGLFGGVTGPVFVRPDIQLPGLTGNFIETVEGSNRSLSVTGSHAHFFLSQVRNNVLGSISNTSQAMGCVTMDILNGGNTWQNYFAGERSGKVIRVSSESGASANYRISLYITSEELAGRNPAALNVAQTTATTAIGSNASNTTVFATTLSAYGTGFVFTANVSGNGLFFLTNAVVTSVRNQLIPSDFVRLLQNPVRIQIQLQAQNPQRDPLQVSLFTLSGQKLKDWNLGPASGSIPLPIGELALPAGAYLLRVVAGKRIQSFKLIKQ